MLLSKVTRPFSLKTAPFAQETPCSPLFCMRTAYWDSGDPEMYFDNPNLRWGDPAYLLEPGDPGYVGPIPTVIKPKKKGKQMKHARYYPERHIDQVAWLANFKDKLPGYATALSLVTGQVTAAVADCGWLQYILELWLLEARAWLKSCTAAALTAQTGTGTGAMTLPGFTAPALPTGVTAQAPGALDRIFALIQVIKKGGKCTDAIAADLRIVGTEAGAPDLSTVEPIIKVKVSGSEVLVNWGWQGNRAWLASCEIHVDRADGHGFGLLTIDTTPNYTDTQPWPANRTVWTYKAIYRADDAQVGRWSQPVSVTVGG